MKELASLHDKHLNRPTLDDSSEEEHAIEITTQEITQVLSRLFLRNKAHFFSFRQTAEWIRHDGQTWPLGLWPGLVWFFLPSPPSFLYAFWFQPWFHGLVQSRVCHNVPNGQTMALASHGPNQSWKIVVELDFPVLAWSLAVNVSATMVCLNQRESRMCGGEGCAWVLGQRPWQPNHTEAFASYIGPAILLWTQSLNCVNKCLQQDIYSHFLYLFLKIYICLY